MAPRSVGIAACLSPAVVLGLGLLTAAASYREAVPTVSPEAALAKAVAGYQRSVTSPWLAVDGQLTDVAVVEARVAAPSSIEVLEYRAPVWQAVRHIALRRGSVYLASGHFTAASKAPPEWLHRLSWALAGPVSRST